MRRIVSGYVDDVTLSRRLSTLMVLQSNEGSAGDDLLRVCLRQLGYRGRNASDEALASDALALEAAGLVRIVYCLSCRTLDLTARGLAYLDRRIDPIPGIAYPDIA